MKLGVAGIEDHQAHKNHHVREPVKRRIEKASKTSDPARETGHLPIQHVKKIGNDEGDAGQKEPPHAKKKTASDVQGDADDGQNVGIDMSQGEPAHHSINDSLGSAPDT